MAATPKDILFYYKNVAKLEKSEALKGQKHGSDQNSFHSDSTWHKMYSSSTKLTCQVIDVYPVPEMTIYRVGSKDGSRPQTLDVIESDVQRASNNGAYNVSISGFVYDNDLIEKYGNQPSIFECLVVFPGIKYENRARITYSPGKPQLL